MRFRCLAFLEQQVEELERAEQDRMEERQVFPDFYSSFTFLLEERQVLPSQVPRLTCFFPVASGMGTLTSPCQL